MAESQRDGAAYRLYVLLVLLLVCIHSLAVRHLPSYLVIVPVPECEELCVGLVGDPLCGKKITKLNSTSSACERCRSDAKFDASFYNLADGSCLQRWEYGILIGYGFAAVSAVGAVPAGLICSYKPRVPVIATALLVWSAATLLQASAHSFRFLLGCRAVVGFSQAFATPALSSAVHDLFPGAFAATAVLSLGLYLGTGSASFSIWIATAAGWRWAVLLAGLSGLLLAALLLSTVAEPRRRGVGDGDPSFRAVLEVLGSPQARVARLLGAAASCKLLAAYCLGAYLPLWYARASPSGYSSSSYAGWNALAVAAGGLFSTVFGFLLGDFWSRFDVRAPCWIGLGSALCSLPLVFLVLDASSFSASIVGLFLLLLVSESWFAPTVALLQASVPRSVSGRTVSVLVACSLVANLGPALMGFLDPGDERIRLHLLWVTLIANLAAALAFWAAGREIALDPVSVALNASPTGPERKGVAFNDHGGVALRSLR